MVSIATSTRSIACWLVLCSLLVGSPGVSAQKAGPVPEPAAYRDVLKYIADGWATLTRHVDRCETLADPKMPKGKPLLYLPAGQPVPPVVRALQQKCSVRVEPLPAVIEKIGTVDVSKIQPHGLLYLENDYVVPGGFFNEMYGWDSYFIILGLLRDGKLDLARGMVENFFYEIEHYGAVLNANRTYYLTRSQPPFLTSMILAVQQVLRAAGKQDRAWLAKAYDYAARDYSMWTSEPHLAGTTGLSRYFDFGKGPVPEVTANKDPYYREVASYFVRNQEIGRRYISDVRTGAPVFSITVCEGSSGKAASPLCSPVRTFSFTADYYKGDRSMRESGFDISFRFGPFGAETHHFAPVCLNSLLYKTEKDLETISLWLGRKDDAHQWAHRAQVRQQNMQKYLWDSARGLFVDYNFRTNAQSGYEYATTFYPLWAGLATAEQARAVARNLTIFEQPGGLTMSNRDTQVQWDYPYGWAPIQLLGIEGLRRYGFEPAASRISSKFLSMVAENFRRDGTIREKYNVVTRSSETNVQAGYKSNVVGFGWTNAVFLELLHALPRQVAVERESRAGAQAVGKIN